MKHNNPFTGFELPAIYEGLLSGKFGPKWPNEDLQKDYTGHHNIDLLRRAFSFVDILAADGAFKEGWMGLDYGCGWGRFASTLLSKGKPSQLDLTDAWQATLDHIEKLNYKNNIFQVPTLLAEGSIEKSKYDFILSFSVFTHLSPKSFDANIPVLLDGLKDGGQLYITVRHAEFFEVISSKSSKQKGEIMEDLGKDGIAFIDGGGDMKGEHLFGDTIVTEKYLSKYGSTRYLGKPHSLQHVFAISR